MYSQLDIRRIRGINNLHGVVTVKMIYHVFVTQNLATNFTSTFPESKCELTKTDMSSAS